MPPADDDAVAVEQACTAVAAAGRRVTFNEVAARTKISRTTLYRRGDLRSLVDEHRAKGGDATVLSGLTVQIDQLRRSLEAVAGNVRRHEERLRRLERRSREPR